MSAPIQPLSETPRGRLERSGAQALSDAELLAVAIGRSLTETHGMLQRTGGLAGLVAEPPGPRYAAVAEIVSRVARAEMRERLSLNQPAAAARYLALRYSRYDQEVMGALYLDSRLRLMEDAELFAGTIARAAVEPRPILRRALELGASAVILFHTHPSGDPSPSAEDLAFTRRLAKAGDVVGVRLVDHLILGGPSRWVSLRQQGAIEDTAPTGEAK